MRRENARIGVLYDSLSDNIGDMAMLDATRDGLRPHGYTNVHPVKLFSAEPQEFDAIVVGGGELIRPQGDRFYDIFRAPDALVLHSVGVWPDAHELHYLKEYSFVSARTTAETNYLRAQGIDAFTSPCPTTLLEAEDTPLPGGAVGRKIAVHLAPTTLAAAPHAVEIINSLDGHHMAVPFTRYNGDRDFMGALPLKAAENVLRSDMGPRQLRSVVSQMDLVIASSLHLTLFALAYGIPFVSLAQPKVLNYLKDRGLDHLTFTDDESLTQALLRAEGSRELIEASREKDQDVSRATFKLLATALDQRPPRPTHIPPTSRAPIEDEMQILLDQARHVRANRDMLINSLFMRNLDNEHHRLTGQANLARAEERLAMVTGLEEQVRELEGEAARLRSEISRLDLELNTGIAGLVRRMLSRVQR